MTTVKEPTKSETLDEFDLLVQRWKENKTLFIQQVIFPQHTMLPFHRQMTNWKGVQYEGKQYEGILAPRGSGKSEVGTIGDSIYEVVHDPNVIAQIVAESELTAKKFLLGIKGHFERNERLRFFYGEHVSKDKWAATEIRSAQGTAIGQKDATISVIGAKGSITGARSTIQYCDDLVSLKNSKTDQLRADLYHWYNTTLCPILNPGGVQKIRGTRYYARDLYYKMLGDFSADAFLKVPALEVRPGSVDERAFRKGIIDEIGRGGRIKYHSTGNACVYPQTEEHSYWPARFPLNSLLQMRERDPISFALQYMNDTKLLRTKLLQPGALQMIPSDEMPNLSELVGYIGVDPARSLDGSGSLFALCVIGVDKATGQVYILREVSRRLASPDEMCRLMSNEYWNMRNQGLAIHGIAIEDNAFQGVLATHIKENHKIYGILPIFPRHTQTDKQMRFVNVAKWFNMMLVYFCRGTYQLMEDVADFPDCTFKDRVDAMMQAFEILESIGVKMMGLPIDFIGLAGIGDDAYIATLDDGDDYFGF